MGKRRARKAIYDFLNAYKYGCGTRDIGFFKKELGYILNELNQED